MLLCFAPIHIAQVEMNTPLVNLMSQYFVSHFGETLDKKHNEGPQMLKLEISKQAVADTVILIPNARDVVIVCNNQFTTKP